MKCKYYFIYHFAERLKLNIFIERMITRRNLENNKSTPGDSERVGGSWHNLPHELVDKILMYLADVDMCGYILIASKSTFQPSEVIFKFLCELIYLKQTRKKQLNVSNWGNSWKSMIIHRPRLRLNGYYSLRTMYTKAYCNDAFWEEKKLESVEVTFYLPPPYIFVASFMRTPAYIPLNIVQVVCIFFANAHTKQVKRNRNSCTATASRFDSIVKCVSSKKAACYTAWM